MPRFRPLSRRGTWRRFCHCVVRYMAALIFLLTRLGPHGPVKRGRVWRDCSARNAERTSLRLDMALVSSLRLRRSPAHVHRHDTPSPTSPDPTPLRATAPGSVTPTWAPSPARPQAAVLARPRPSPSPTAPKAGPRQPQPLPRQPPPPQPPWKPPPWKPPTPKPTRADAPVGASAIAAAATIAIPIFLSMTQLRNRLSSPHFLSSRSATGSVLSKNS